MADTLLDIIGRIVTYQEEGEEAAVQYRAMLAPEGIETSDGRFIQEGALTWRDGRLPLTWTDQEMGHETAFHVGNLENLRKETIDGVVWVVADVDWDTDDEAVEARRLVDEDRLRGVSIHLAEADADLDCPDDDTVGMEGCLLTVSRGVIGAATIVTIPAFEDAQIEAVTNEEPDAAAVAASASLYSPPRTWFDDPGLSEPTFTTITEEGRIYGHVTPPQETDGQPSCHLGFPFTCVQPPMGNVDFEEFHGHARVHTEDGALLPVGVLTFGGGHAPSDRPLTPEQAMAHYDSTSTVGGYVRAGEDEYGTWIAGALAPGLTQAEIENLRRLSLSGDWRPRGGTFVFAAALAVPVPGFSIKARVASGLQTSLITVGPKPPAEEPTDLALVASAITDLRSIVGQFRADMEPLVAEHQARELEEAFALFGD